MKKLLPLLLALFCAPAFATPSISQCVISTSITISTGGDSLVVIMQGTAASGATFTSISDSQSQAITNDAAYALMSDTGAGKFFPTGAWRIPSANSGAHTITVSGVSLTNVALLLCEVSGISGFDVAQSSTTSFGTGTAITSGSLTPSQTGDLLISGYTVAGASGITFSAYTNSFVQQVLSNGAAPTTQGASVVDSAATSITSGATASSSNTWGAYLVSYKAAASGTCTHSGITSAGAISVPNGTTGSYRLANGTIGTPDCSTKLYPNTAGGIAVN